MRAPFELTEGLGRLQSILAARPAGSADWNEAQNRFQFVDRLLTECLGWEKPFIKVEERDDAGGRSDYVLGMPVKAILEAKRESIIFNIPAGGKVGVVRKLRPLIHSCKDLEQAVIQVLSYCALQGAQIAAVCNGPQLLIFQAIIAGQSPLDGECYLFNGFNEYVDEFGLLWNLLSPDGIAENRAYRDLALHRNPRIPAKASTAIPEPYRYRYRTDFQENLRVLSAILLEDIEDHPDVKPAFYKECYVPIEANNRHILLSKRVIEARYRRANDSSASPLALGSKSFRANKGTLEIDADIISEAMGARPIVVVGDVGVGKTSFFENLYEQIDAEQKPSIYFVNINLGTKATLTEDIRGYIVDEVSASLLSAYGLDLSERSFVESIYHGDMKRFESSVVGKLKEIDPAEYEKERIKFLAAKAGDKGAHLRASLAHLVHGRQKQIIIVIDNADQRDFDTQQQAFLIAQELAASRSALVFVALRPSTFFQSKLTGALSGYQNRVLTIAPPPADEVLEKRISFAVRVAEGKIAPAALSNIRLNLGSIVTFLKATLRSIRQSAEIRQFLSNITGGNTRLVIEMMTGFCGSPNVDSRKIVEVEDQGGAYIVPLHEFTKHALLGEYAYFNSLSSTVACNIFDVSTADAREHFLAGLVITFLSSPLGKRDNDGFVSGHDVVAEMTRYGYIEEQIRFALRRLATRRLIETPHAHFRELQVDDSEPAEKFHFRATSIGIYHIRYWMGSFAFLDATCTDTPIFEERTREAIFRVADSLNIDDRLDRSENFRRYLDDQWQLANINTSYFDFSSLVNAQDSTFDGVRKAAGRSPRGRRP